MVSSGFRDLPGFELEPLACFELHGGPAEAPVEFTVPTQFLTPVYLLGAGALLSTGNRRDEWRGQKPE